MKVEVEYCGERFAVEPDAPVAVGREGQLCIDDNPFLHRRFLEVRVVNGLCWLVNLGTQLSATVVDDASRVQAWLSPGASLPLVFERAHVRFTAGPTTYEFAVEVDGAPFTGGVSDTPTTSSDVEATIGMVPLTTDQRLLIVALAEPLLRQEGRGTAALPSSADAAKRLGWTSTKFTRKLDNVCDKLTKMGVRGLHGKPGQLAANRRARLVEYAVSVGLVRESDLADLPQFPN